MAKKIPGKWSKVEDATMDDLMDAFLGGRRIWYKRRYSEWYRRHHNNEEHPAFNDKAYVFTVHPNPNATITMKLMEDRHNVQL